MLLFLRIENFALVDRLDWELDAGLTVLTGETGAGKSIILDAIDAVLGGKVTSRAVRTGAERALVEATFRLEAELSDWLKEQSIDGASADGALGTLVCSREIVASGGSQRSRSRVNGVLVNKQQMEHLRERLVELTAQGQTVQLGQPGLQRDWLDSYGGDVLLKTRDQVGVAFSAYQQAVQTLENRRRAERERLQQLDLFDYQLRDLNSANLTNPDELEQLEQEAKRLSHSVELQQQSYVVYQTLYQSDTDAKACADLLGRAEKTLTDMVEIDTELQPILELVTGAFASVEEAAREINAYGEDIEADPQRLSDVQERTSQLKQVCRKYGPTLAEAIDLRDRLQAELLELTGGGQSAEELEQAVKDTQQILETRCTELTHLRQAAAKDLESRLIGELKPLAMEKVKFQVGIAAIAPTATGADQITYLFSPNPGEPLQPLTDTASGGEMSRFLLALQASFSQVDPVGTLVFDEIDVGVSGRVSQAIAEKLFQLSQHHQVLCVTHQPIVAAMADHHFRVSKQIIESSEAADNLTSDNGATKPGKSRRGSKNSKPEIASTMLPDQPTLHTSATDAVRTVVRITPLSNEDRKQELAQLAGGQSAQEVIAFAESLLTQAAAIRQTHVREEGRAIATELPAASKTTRAKTAKKA
ncbi:DNA repair protein RecN [Phormidium sp. CLA17]|uniref:DNA repair protein RecN n=1 Tax=Leptolyngbya sp. Cla-17 TaxID=2803751 RepID=UPI001491634E|nr:DNA repair protein RecN [Leptolyngbya sp. Cla-17]MBM0742558.1 DNA repair protein RecN [Leptolyngbya sp. Cla-17]